MTPVDAVVSGSIAIPNLGLKAIDRVRHELAYSNPEYTKTFITKGSRDGISSWLSAMEEFSDGTIRVPRGAVAELRKGLAACDLEPRWIDRRTDGKEIQRVDVDLRSYQQDALAQVKKSLQGCVIMACGGGKTRLGIAIVGSFGRSALILVHTEDLLDQWVEHIKKLLGVDPGIVSDGQCDWKDVTVAMVQTLRGEMARATDGPWDHFGVCIVDEAHHAPAYTYQQILPRIPARVRIGLTATERDDDMNSVMYWSFGKRLVEFDARFLIRNGWLMAPEIEFVKTLFTFKYDGPDRTRTHALRVAVTNDHVRNDLVAQIVARENSAGSMILVLTNDKRHCKMLVDRINELGVSAIALMGTITKKQRQDGIAAGDNVKYKKKDRKKVIGDMRSGNARVVIATSLADEGLDITILSHVVLALPGASDRETKQRIGRIMRPHAGKYPRLYDIVDDQVDTLKRRAAARRRAYRDLGLIP